jgi:hypothetical protein
MGLSTWYCCLPAAGQRLMSPVTGVIRFAAECALSGARQYR